MKYTLEKSRPQIPHIDITFETQTRTHSTDQKTFHPKQNWNFGYLRRSFSKIKWREEKLKPIRLIMVVKNNNNYRCQIYIICIMDKVCIEMHTKYKHIFYSIIM